MQIITNIFWVLLFIALFPVITVVEFIEGIVRPNYLKQRIDEIEAEEEHWNNTRDEP